MSFEKFLTSLWRQFSQNVFPRHFSSAGKYVFFFLFCFIQTKK